MAVEKSWTHHAFGFSGRANRAKFWLIPLASLVVSVALVALVFSVDDYSFSWLAGVLLIPVGVVTLWIATAVTVRRLHDRNKRGHWAWLYIGVPPVLNGLNGGFGESGEHESGDRRKHWNHDLVSC